MLSQELACIVRPAGKSCECEGCTTRCAQEAELDRQKGTRMDKGIEVGVANTTVCAIHQLYVKDCYNSKAVKQILPVPTNTRPWQLSRLAVFALLCCPPSQEECIRQAAHWLLHTMR